MKKGKPLVTAPVPRIDIHIKSEEEQNIVIAAKKLSVDLRIHLRQFVFLALKEKVLREDPSLLSEKKK